MGQWELESAQQLRVARRRAWKTSRGVALARQRDASVKEYNGKGATGDVRSLPALVGDYGRRTKQDTTLGSRRAATATTAGRSRESRYHARDVRKLRTRTVERRSRGSITRRAARAYVGNV